jgi:hypothetical protein
MLAIGDSTATLAAAFISAGIGSVIGPFILRRLRRGDAALDARRAWVKEKLVSVFGEGEAFMSTDDVDYFAPGLISENPWTPLFGDMHAINPSLQESLDLKVIQPWRSAVLRRWLEGWFWLLQAQSATLRSLGGEYAAHHGLGPGFDKEIRRYERRFRRVEVAMTRWSLGLRPTLFFWAVTRVQTRRVDRWFSHEGQRLERLYRHERDETGTPIPRD